MRKMSFLTLTREYPGKTPYGLVADESRGVKRKHEDEEGDDDAAAQWSLWRYLCTYIYKYFSACT